MKSGLGVLRSHGNGLLVLSDDLVAYRYVSDSRRFYSDAMTTRSASRTPAPRHRAVARSTVVSALAVASIVALTACSSTTNARSSAAAEAAIVSNPVPTENANAGAMPLDQYIPTQIYAADYAENLLVEPCMNKAGYAWNVPWQDLMKDHTPSLNAAGVNDFSETLAEQWGYHFAPVDDPSNATWHAFAQSELTLSDAKEAALTACVSSARKVLPRLSVSAQVGAQLSAQADDAAEQDPSVKKADGRWVTCMLPEGITDLPADPQDMPSASLTARFSITQDVSTTVPIVSSAERAVAVADAKCRASSGYDSTLNDDEWNRQTQLLARNADELQRARDAMTANQAAVEKVIAEDGPRH
jgi:hypothetical protein